MGGAQAVVTRYLPTAPAPFVFACAAALALCTTVALGFTDSWFDDQRIVAVSLLGAGLVAALLGPRRICVRWPEALLFVFLVLGAIAALRAPRPAVALCEWAVYAAIAAIVMNGATRPDPATRSTHRAAALFAVLVAGVYCVGVLARYASAGLLGAPLGADTMLVGFSNPRFAAQLEALTVPFLPLAWRLASTRSQRVLVAAVAALWWMCLIGSGSRTAWAALAVAGGVLALSGLAGRRWVAWQAIAAVAGLAAYLALFVAVPAALGWPTELEGTRAAQTSSIAARFALWRLALDAVFASPWLGIGPMHFAYANTGDAAHPHNQMLQWAAEWGVPAALCVATAAITLLGALWRHVARQDRADDLADASLAACVLAAVVVLLVGSQADGYLVVPTSQVAATVVLLLAVGQVVPVDTRPASAPTRVASLAWRLTGCAALAVLIALPFTAFGQPTAREAQWRAEHPAGFLWPRFWQQGWIGPDEDPSARPARSAPRG